MYLKKKKSITPGLRHQIRFPKSLLSRERPFKYLIQRIKQQSGRNSQGKITIRHRGGRGKVFYRNLDLLVRNFGGVVLGIEYDPNRTTFLARLFNLHSKKFFYLPANNALYPGSIVEGGEFVEARIGNRMQLRNMPSGSIISLVSNKEGTKVIFSRSGGTYCQLLQKGNLTCKIRVPSGKIIEVSSFSYATLGSLSNPSTKLEVLGKAGINRKLGKRPSVRGVAMNPIDHPHGGGEGKTSGGRPSVSLWGRPVRGKKKKKNV